MSLKGKTNEEKIWNFFKSKGFNDFAIAGLMGNIFAESGLASNNLQNTGNTKLGMTDEQYTAAVDNGTYSNFVKDSQGYGLAQWTYWSRKQNLLNYAKSKKKSIGDLETQLEFLYSEIQGYTNVFNTLKSATSVQSASDSVLTGYEKPADQSNSVKLKRAGYGQTYYNKYAKKTSTKKEVTTVSNSSLVTYTNITKTQKTSPRNHAIDTITIHCVVGQWTAKQICDFSANTNRNASCNYGVGKDGSIGLNVDEKDRSWCSSNPTNDHRAITIEVASDTSDPYAVTDAAYNALIKLVADICKRNNIKKLVWSTNKTDRVNHLNGCNMTVHRDYDNKSCPGEYLYSRMGDIAKKVNAILGSNSSTDTNKKGENKMANTVDKVIAIAKAEVGYLEKKSNSQLDSKTANAGSANYTKYGRDMHKVYPAVMDFPAYWCDAFVDWCFYKAYGVCNAKALLGGNFDDYTINSAQLYKNKGAWYTSKPKVGDQIFFNNGKRICHTGLVYKVDASYVYTIEGNTSSASGVVANGGCVAYKKYALGSSKISGYGRPKYDKDTSSKKPSNPDNKKDDKKTDNKKKVVAGAESFSKSIAGTYKVTASDGLNLRYVPGKLTSDNVVCAIPNAKKIQCYGYYTVVDGTKWYLIAYGSKTGFVSSAYLKKC